MRRHSEANGPDLIQGGRIPHPTKRMRFNSVATSYDRQGAIMPGHHPTIDHIVRKFGRIALAMGLALSLALGGATVSFSASLVAILISFSGLAAASVTPRDPRAHRLVVFSLLIPCFVATILLLQIKPSILSGISDSFNVSWPHSVDAGESLKSLISVTMPFIVFSAALLFFQERSAALWLISFISYAGCVVGFIGLIQLEFFPTGFSNGSKTHYVDSLTGLLTNRNSVATFLGIASFASIINVISSSVNFRPLSAIERFKYLLKLTGTFLIFASFFMTSSRGAFLALGISYFVVSPIMIVWKIGQINKKGVIHNRYAIKSILFRVVIFLTSTFALIFLLEIFGGRALFRMIAEGYDAGRLCVYGATMKMFIEYWILGTGLGTFDVMFPQYRSEGCGSIYLSYVRAHSFFLEGASSLGFVFILICLFVYSMILYALWIGVRNRKHFRFVPLFGFAIVLFVTLHSFIDFSLQVPAVAIFLAALLAAIANISLLPKKKRVLDSEAIPTIASRVG